MRQIAHIVNPVVVPKSSDLFFAQPITFESMRVAQSFARDEVDIHFFTAQYPEDRALIPPFFESTVDLDRSILDFGSFAGNRKLPLIKDILDRLYEATQAEYLIYTNVDIAIMPYFYSAVNQIIEQGFDAFVINRRSIPGHYQKVNQLTLMYGEAGQPHPGHDCFIFRRDTYPDFILGSSCIGAVWIGRAMIFNLALHGRKYKEFRDKHLTFHIGSDRAWQSDDHSPYNQFNEEQVRATLNELQAKHGPFSPKDPIFGYIQSFNDKKYREIVSLGATKRSRRIKKIKRLLGLSTS